jgi:ATP-dependent exoDNAse (exonuclease V) beta subunit
MSTVGLPDAVVRERIRRDLDTSFAVDASAGTGKTSLLIDRIVALLVTGKAPLSQIAAITFTEKAAGELKMRLRDQLEHGRIDPQWSAAERDRLQKALEDFERASIGTIHGFCAGILRDYPLEAGVGPGFTVLDPLAVTLLRRQVWERWLAGEMDRSAPPLSAALDAGVRLDRLAETAVQWLERRAAAGAVPSPCDADVPGFIALLDRSLPVLLGHLVHCVDSADGGSRSIAALAAAHQQLAALPAVAQPSFLLHRLHVRAAGNQRHWRPPGVLREVKRVLREVGDAHRQLCTTLAHNQTCDLYAWLDGYADAYARAKRQRGVLDFDDLLLATRDLLLRHPEIRGAVQARIRHLLVDEFQDTDPLQVEIVFLLAERGPRAAAWRDVIIAPGRLFLVGDPKQSIYRFRRADIEMYEDAKALLRAQGEVLVLDTNFRSTGPLIEWVNACFAPLVLPPPDGTYQPAYAPLAAGPDAAPGGPASVWCVPIRCSEASASRADDWRRAEARTMVAAIHRLVANDQWRVRTPGGGVRRLTYGDIGVLFRRNDAIRWYEDELREFDVPHRVIGGRRFYQRRELGDLLAALTAVANPADPGAVVATLRGPCCGFSDEELFLFHRRGGVFDYRQPVPDAVPAAGDFRAAAAWLRELHARGQRRAPAALLHDLYASSHLLPLFYAKPQGEQLVANLVKVLDVARQLERDGVITLQGLVAVLGRLRDLEAEEEESPVSEPGDDVVRLLTIHKAKGLEFPLVVLADAAQGLDVRLPCVVADRAAGRLALRVPGSGGRLRTADWEAAGERETRRARAEEIRLLYVAATRARDYLLLPRYPSEHMGAFAAKLAAGHGREHVLDTTSLDTGERPLRSFRSAPAPLSAPAPISEWEALRAARQATGVPQFTSPSLLPHPPIRCLPTSGTDGVRLGRLVHTVLERADLAAATNAEALVALLAGELGCSAAERALALNLIRRACTLPPVRRAVASGTYHREVPFLIRAGHRVIEGAADLVFREGGELVIVDFKTDAIATESLAAAVAAYAPQVVLYAFALQRATGLPVKEAWLAFLRAGCAERLHLDWEAEAARVLAQVGEVGDLAEIAPV